MSSTKGYLAARLSPPGLLGALPQNRLYWEWNKNGGGERGELGRAKGFGPLQHDGLGPPVTFMVCMTGCIPLPRVQTSTGQRSFALCVPTVWNSLPRALHDNSLPLNAFKRKLKTQFFRLRRCCYVTFL